MNGNAKTSYIATNIDVNFSVYMIPYANTPVRRKPGKNSKVFILMERDKA